MPNTMLHDDAAIVGIGELGMAAGWQPVRPGQWGVRWVLACRAWQGMARESPTDMLYRGCLL